RRRDDQDAVSLRRTSGRWIPGPAIRRGAGTPDRRRGTAHAVPRRRFARSVPTWPGAPAGTTLRVGLAGFEPAASRPPDGCAPKLRHSPKPVRGPADEPYRSRACARERWVGWCGRGHRDGCARLSIYPAPPWTYDGRLGLRVWWRWVWRRRQRVP